MYPRLLLLGLLLPASAAAATIDFSRDILPILSDACFHCHGPDEATREADLRLDTKDGLFRTADGVTVVAPGKLEASELILRVSSKDRDEVMPPPKAARQLKPEEIARLKQWVAEGAVWQRHWAFEPMQRPAVPQVSGALNPIDAFVGQRLAQEKLDFSPEAAPEMLLRRLTLDLTGLPPTLAELDTFLRDYRSPDGLSQKEAIMERTVDRLLASPRYGEHLASEWLDVARFADTHGYQMDATRAMWPYRDWVIKAFNENLSYDQFGTWQLAGDLLPKATREQRLATAFNRLHMQNEEGGIVEEEFRVAYVVDRVNTMGTAFLGLTFECARCHDHKYDPLSQRDFYSMFAFFQNIDEAGQNPYTGFVNDMPEPVLLLSTPEQDQQLATLEQAIAAKERELAHLEIAARQEFGKRQQSSNDVDEPAPTAGYDFDELLKDTSPNIKQGGPAAKANEKPTLIDGVRGRGAALDGESGFTFPGVGDFNRADEFSISLWLRAPEASRAVVLHHTRAPVDAGSRGYELLIENQHLAFGLHHLWPGNSLKVASTKQVPAGEWVHVAITYDGCSRAGGVHLYLNGERAELKAVRDGLSKDITYPGGEPPLTLGFRFRDNGLKDGAVDELRLFDRALTALEVAKVANRKPHSPEALPADLFSHYFARSYEPAQRIRAELAALRDEQRKLIEPIPEIMAMRELPQPRKAYLLKRGAYDSPGEEVPAITPAVLPPLAAKQTPNRLDLARWLFDPEHPLTARVTVNRYWQLMFGRGLVETAENFGSQGAQPSHPELLDWLARDFIASGWNVKALLKKIALSKTYRQSSGTVAAADPDNRLLSRGPSRRLSAEMLRDQALAVSGLLVERLGGPSVKPYQPPGLWEEIAMGKPRYDQGKGADLYRRSLYTFWKRTVPPPALVTFDAADRSNCSVRRQSTSTPLQALALLNDVQHVEAARVLAQRMVQTNGSLKERIVWVFRTITSRRPTPKEVEVLEQLHDEQLAMFRQDGKAAGELINYGETRADPALPPADLAAATILCQALFNHDLAVMRR